MVQVSPILERCRMWSRHDFADIGRTLELAAMLCHLLRILKDESAEITQREPAVPKRSILAEGHSTSIKVQFPQCETSAYL